MQKIIYFFGNGKAEGNIKMKKILGGKGAGLAEMTNIGIPVPPGFTISSEVCIYYYKNREYPEGLEEKVTKNIQSLEDIMGENFGLKENPLLVSVRSGAAISMPGMMDTILNLGLNEEIVKGICEETGDPRFVYDSYRRLVQMYGDVVMGVKHDDFEKIIQAKKDKRGVQNDAGLEWLDWKDIVKEFKNLIKDKTGKQFPESPKEQLMGAITAVFKSWDNKRAKEYRRINSIPDDLGTAINVQAMVFGNKGDNSGTGVAFTRNPATGENVFYGEYLLNAQGEDVVAGIRTPGPISEKQAMESGSEKPSLEKRMPVIYNQLEGVRRKLERHFKDTQDLEFTVENNKLWILQTRTGKRTAMAAVKMAIEMQEEGLIDKKEAVMRVTPENVEQLLHPMIDPEVEVEVIAKGLPASPGAASGKVVFSADQAVEKAKNEEKVILVRHVTSPEDVGGMHASVGILTSRGGMTSHAAVVARGMGKPCIVGAEGISINYDEEVFTVNGKTIKEGDIITIDGSKGRVLLGDVPKIEPEVSGNFGKLLEWADEIRRLGIQANADTYVDAKKAREFGAEGIGLARTEHMFFAKDRISAMQEMILAETHEERKKALEKILPMQRKDFEGLFKVMDGYPVIIRLLDPPLHEFLPKNENAIKELALNMGISVQKVEEKVKSLEEANPMLGLRGCRLGILFPEITEMQSRAILEAAVNVSKEGVKVLPKIMIPLAGYKEEITSQKEIIKKVAKEVFERNGLSIDFKVGTMIELPRAAIVADEIAEEAEFFSFGTNDLTQTTLGFSRDDVGKYIPGYIEKRIISADPFQTLDQKGVGQLVEMGLKRGKNTKPDLEVGICGEHGGDPASIEFCHRVGLDYVSCSPFRVPSARLTAAQAAIKGDK
ncbi:MAG: pyruvate, phosphate dikinase [candidate division WOR-3 bacterium]|nr:pyruvate, phosphate dikinase [candidate division WOR-3 bacterium]